jgi:hypothetical protein
MERLDIIQQNLKAGRKASADEIAWLIEQLESAQDSVTDLQKKLTWTERDRDLWKERYENVNTQNYYQNDPRMVCVKLGGM